MEFSELALGTTVYQADPWERKVYTKQVVEVATYEHLRYSKTETSRRVRVAGGIMGVGVQLTKDNWGKTYFLDHEEARRACCEHAVALEAERKTQLEGEITGLQKELEKCKT